MTCGTVSPNPAELVNTKTTREIIAEAGGEYDFVIIDAPPILAATDAAIWADPGRRDRHRLPGRQDRPGSPEASQGPDRQRPGKYHRARLNGLKAEISPDFDYHDKYYYYYGSNRKKPSTRGGKVLSWLEWIRRQVKSLRVTNLQQKGLYPDEPLSTPIDNPSKVADAPGCGLR